jgi:hypothetical protein
MKYTIYSHFNLSNYISKEEYFSKIFNYVFNRFDEKLITTQLQNQVRLEEEIHLMDHLPEYCIEHVIDFSKTLELGDNLIELIQKLVSYLNESNTEKPFVLTIKREIEVPKPVLIYQIDIGLRMFLKRDRELIFQEIENILLFFRNFDLSRLKDNRIFRSTTLIGDIDSYSTEKVPFDLRYCSMDEVMKFVNDELDDVFEEKRDVIFQFISDDFRSKELPF